MRATLFKEIVNKAVDENKAVTIITDNIASNGGYSSCNAYVKVPACKVNMFDEHIVVSTRRHTKNLCFISIENIEGDLYVEYEHIVSVIIMDKQIDFLLEDKKDE